jgi:excinuclease ABC subunit C
VGERQQKGTRTPAFDSATLIGGLPSLPGVYRMLGAAGDVLYVGKARDLKKRVSSYFQKTSHSPRIQIMLSQVASMETTVTRTEAEALILENNLIKSLSPRYNILFRDDKSYPYLMISGGEFPRLGFHRGSLDKANRYFGPFPDSNAVRDSIQLLQKVFRLRTCEDSVFANRSRPCLLHQIRRCSAPCVKLIDAESYAADTERAQMLMDGRTDDVMAELAVRMSDASAQLHFEQAAVFRDQIQSLATVKSRQYIDSGKALDADVIACALKPGSACVNLVMLRGGRQVGDKSFFPQNAQDQTRADVVSAFLNQHYLLQPIPPLLIVGDDSIDADELGAMLSEHAGRRVQLVIRPQGERRVWSDMAQQNAELALAQKLREQSTQEKRLLALRQALSLPETVRRVECFDISHTQGEATVASCVVYDRMDLRRNEYRRYNIDGITPGDDYAAMRSVLTRRYEKISREEGIMPDLILLDGGKGQVSAGKAIMAELGLADIHLVGVAKGPERKAGMEELILAGTDTVVSLAADNPGLHLIQQIRDEAHRFAITGHRARRGKARVTSSLESIGGIGAKRRQQLLASFGGLKGVIDASIDDLAKVDGISKKLAEKIYGELH